MAANRVHWKSRDIDAGTYQSILDTKITPIGDLADGLAAVQGKAVALQTRPSPLLSMPVVGYHLSVQGKAGVHHHCEVNPFEVDDGTGRVRVEADIPSLILQKEFHQQAVDLNRSIVVDVERIISQKLGFPTKAASWTLRYLSPGEDVYVRGMARMLVDPETAAANYRDNALRPSLVAPPNAPLLVADMHQEPLLRWLSRSGGAP